LLGKFTININGNSNTIRIKQANVQVGINGNNNKIIAIDNL